jgi:hypothetical protein
VPLVSPVNTHEVEAPVREVEHAAGVVTDGLEVTVYPVRAEPPVPVGTVQAMVAVVAEVVATAVTPVGGAGRFMVIALDAAEATLLPLTFFAVTVKVYAVPLVSPVKTHEVEAPVREVEQAAGVVTDGDDVTVKPVRAEPPLLAGAVQAMVADVDNVVAVAVTPVGASGVVDGMAAADAAELVPMPTPLVAVTVNV